MLLTTTINGRKREILIKDDDYLLDVLRKEGVLEGLESVSKESAINEVAAHLEK